MLHHSKRIFGVLGAAVVSGLLLRGCLLPMLAHSRMGAQAEVCSEHVKTLTRALLAYADDHAGRFPDPASWCDSLVPYVSSRTVFTCPAAHDLRCGYAFNAAAGAVNARGVSDPRYLILVFESDAGWNAAGGAELLPVVPRHDRSITDMIGTADGTASQIVRKRAGSPDQSISSRTVWLKEYANPAFRWRP